MKKTDKKSEKIGIYIHIPFCRSKCDYCDFYSLAGADSRMDDYQNALLAHVREVSELATKSVVDTIYIGGGTPSYYGAKRIKEILKTLKKQFNIEKNAEITVECNPDSVNKGFFRSLRWAGVNRFSMGMQSSDSGELTAIGRPHSFDQTKEAVEAARKAKIKNLSLDIIYGLPQQSDEGWKQTISDAIALNPEHISAYGLKIEEGTPLFDRVRQGETVPDDDVQAERYLWTVDRLKEAGYDQYEISNFAKAGQESRHNLRYWQIRPYIGFGPGAHSDFGDRRYSMIRDLEGYIAGVMTGGALVDEHDLIPQRERGSEYLMLGLRTVEGIDEDSYRRRYSRDFAPIQQKLEGFALQGWAVQTEDGRWHFTPRGMLLSNILIGQVLEVQQPEELQKKINYAKSRFGGENTENLS